MGTHQQRFVRSDNRGIVEKCALAAAHAALDRAVDKCYRPAPFPSDRARVEYLFALYETLTAPLAPTPKSPRKKRAS